MKLAFRYVLILILLVFLALCYYRHRWKYDHSSRWRKSLPQTYSGTYQKHQPPSMPIPLPEFLQDHNKCRMETCFNFTKCSGRPFKVYVYPEDEYVIPSDNYAKIVNRLRQSTYYTPNPDEACLFVLSLDTLDRDSDNGQNNEYVKNLPGKLANLQPLWNGGFNHLVFNLYSGTYKNDYLETALDFNWGRAILAKASISDEFYRPGFDVSLPLFHKSHPARGSDAKLNISNTFPVSKPYFLAFKGKRYLHGKGSDTRNSLYHLHNGHDLVLVTTCRHGKDWERWKDERCDEDNMEFDRFDYDDLLTNATFCLVPRGRRLGSFRFMETLRAGCVPVLLSNGWRLPFAEVIDWSQAVIEADERLLLQVPEILHSVPQSKIFAMRQQTQILYDRYLSSVEKIVDTTIEIIKERIKKHENLDGLIWNSDPGALMTPLKASTKIPFDLGALELHKGCEDGPYFPPNKNTKNNNSKNNNITTSPNIDDKFTAVIYTQLASASTQVHLSAPIFKLARNVAASQFVDQIIVIWTASHPPPPTRQWPFIGGRTDVPIKILHQPQARVSQRFQQSQWIRTEAILSLDDDAAISTEEVDFAFEVWQHFSDRLVGFPSRSHFWDDRKHQWAYTSKWGNEYSMILPGAAFYHRYYDDLFSTKLSPSLIEYVDSVSNCEDILINFLISHVTRKSPIKVTQRKKYQEPSPSGVKSPWTDPSHFDQRQICINRFVSEFGYMPLLKSSMRLDPVLFKDNVANTRKKYRKLEMIPIQTGSTHKSNL